MVKNNLVKAIFDREMDRKEFLKYSGLVLLSVFGLKGLISLLSVPEKIASSDDYNKRDNRGFGSGKYGV